MSAIVIMEPSSRERRAKTGPISLAPPDRITAAQCVRISNSEETQESSVCNCRPSSPAFQDKPKPTPANRSGRRGVVRVALSPIPMTAAASAAIAAAGWALLAGTRFIDGQSSSLQFLSAEHGNGFGRIGLRSHFDEPKAARATGGLILHDVDDIDAARLRE